MSTMNAMNNIYIFLITECFVILVGLRYVFAASALNAILQMPQMNLSPSVRAEFQKSNKNNNTQVNLPSSLGITTTGGVITFRSSLAEQMHNRQQSMQLNLPPNQSPIVAKKSIPDPREKDEVLLVWETQYGMLDSKDVKHYSELLSHYTYIVTKVNRDEELESLTVYYWIGQYSNKVDAAHAAAYAVGLDSNKKIKINREFEGKESDEFRALFEEDNINNMIMPKEDVSKKINPNSKRMFLIYGKDYVRFKEVNPLLSNVPGDEDRCMVFISKKAQVFCASRASVRQEQVAKKLARAMLQKRGVNNPEISYYKNDVQLWEVSQYKRAGLRQLWDEIDSIPKNIAEEKIVDNPDEFTPKELREILDQTATSEDGQEIFYAKITRFYLFVNKDGSEEVKKIDLPSPNVAIATLNPEDSYLIDSRSNVGLFVWLGNKSDSRVRKECARSAELLFPEKFYSYSEPIIYVGPEDVPDEVQDIQGMITFLNPTNDKDGQSSISDEVIKNKRLEENRSVSKFVKKTRRRIKNSNLGEDVSISKTIVENTSSLEENTNLVESEVVSRVQKRRTRKKPTKYTNLENDIPISETVVENTSNLEGITNLEESEVVSRVQTRRTRKKPTKDTNLQNDISISETVVENTSSLEENTNLEESAVVSRVQKKRTRKKPTKGTNLENDITISETEVENTSNLKENTESEVVSEVQNKRTRKKLTKDTNLENDIPISETVVENTSSLEENINSEESEVVSRVQKKRTKKMPIKNINLENDVPISKTVMENASEKEGISTKLEDEGVETHVQKKSRKKLIKNSNFKNDISVSRAEEENTSNSLKSESFDDNTSTSKVIKRNKKLTENSNLKSNTSASSMAQPATNLTFNDSERENNIKMKNFDMVKKNIDKSGVGNSGREKRGFLPKTVQQPISEPLRKSGRPRKNNSQK